MNYIASDNKSDNDDYYGYQTKKKTFEFLRLLKLDRSNADFSTCSEAYFILLS